MPSILTLAFVLGSRLPFPDASMAEVPKLVLLGPESRAPAETSPLALSPGALDPYANAVNPYEYVSGLIGWVLGASGSVVIGIFLVVLEATFIPITSCQCASLFLLPLSVSALLPPLFAIWFASTEDDRQPRAGALWKSFALSFGVSLVGLALEVLGLAFSASYLWVAAVGAGLQFLGVPLAASFGLHWSPAAAAPPPSPSADRSSFPSIGPGFAFRF